MHNTVDASFCKVSSPKKLNIKMLHLRSENLSMPVCDSAISKGASAVYMKHRQNAIYLISHKFTNV